MHVVLRPLDRTDSAQVFAWRDSKRVAPFLYRDHVGTPVAQVRWLDAALSAAQTRRWVIEADGVALGLADLAEVGSDGRLGEWAYYLAGPDMYGRGVGAAVEYLMLRHAFEILGLDRLGCAVFTDNSAVWRLHQSFGFSKEAPSCAQVGETGVMRDLVRLGLSREAWPAARRRAESRLAGKLSAWMIERAGDGDLIVAAFPPRDQAADGPGSPPVRAADDAARRAPADRFGQRACD